MEMVEVDQMTSANQNPSPPMILVKGDYSEGFGLIRRSKILRARSVFIRRQTQDSQTMGSGEVKAVPTGTRDQGSVSPTVKGGQGLVKGV